MKATTKNTIINDLKKLLEKAEDLDWNYTIWNESDKRNYVELSKYSPLGEYFSMIIDFDTKPPVLSFLDNLREYHMSFDPDEHAEMWIPKRGENGVPKSIRDLIDDAEDIEDMIWELWDVLTDYYKEINNY